MMLAPGTGCPKAHARRSPAPDVFTATKFRIAPVAPSGTAHPPAVPPWAAKFTVPLTRKSRGTSGTIGPPAPATRVSMIRHGVTGVYTRSAALAPRNAWAIVGFPRLHPLSAIPTTTQIPQRCMAVLPSPAPVPLRPPREAPRRRGRAPAPARERERLRVARPAARFKRVRPAAAGEEPEPSRHRPRQ